MPDNSKRRERESGDTGDGNRNRHAWFFERRHLADGTLPFAGLARGSRQKRALELHATEARAPMLRSRVAGPAVDAYWTPLGPAVVAHGQAAGRPIVSGRIPSLAVGPGGTRVYAGSANGGVWFSEDSGASWTPIDLYALPPQTAKLAHMEADSLSTGAIAVRFGAGAAQDQIFVGTGEPQQGSDNPSTIAPNVGDSYFGVGIKTSPSGGTAPVWTLEATNLAGHGVFRIVVDPDDPTVVFAATSNGLYMRPRSAPFTIWTPITSGIAVGSIACDLIISGRGANKVYFAAVWAGSVYRSPDATNAGGGTWTAVPGLAATGRIALATSDVPASGATPAIVYALGADSTLFRLDAAPTGSFQQVAGIPKALFFGGQGYYDIALAVDPSNQNTVYLVGDTIVSDDWNLSIYKGTITGIAPNYVFPFNPSNDMTGSGSTKDSSHVSSDPTWIGQGIHADGHCIAFATNPDGTHDATNVWVGCDGGVFQSTQSGARGSFQPRNRGLAITQITYLAQHPATDTVMIGGAQDQGNLRFRGDQVCFEEPEGDGGGCVYDPNNGYRVMRQYNYAELFTATDGGKSGDWTDLKDAKKFPPIGSSPTAAQKTAADTESKATSFYAPITAIAVDATHTLAAFGTNRLWVTPDWGDTWTTIPSNTNPYAGGGVNAAADALGSSVTAIAWASPTTIYVATNSSVYRFDLAGGNWGPNPPAALPVAGLPAGRFITSIAVENPTTGTIYITLGGGNVDHVWYFDPGPNNWVSAGLAQATLDVPCHSIVVDPAHTEQIYLGTDVGVFKGVKSGPAWSWTPFSNTLPECAATCLLIQPVTRVLRAATHGLGVWEIPLDIASLPDPDLYLRANAADSGRVPRPAWLHGMGDPTQPGNTLDLVSSPDIKVLRSSHSTLSTTPDFLGFASLGNFETDLNTFDTLGTNQIFIEVHNRGKTRVDGGQVRVLLLLADGSAALPALPADFATRLQNGDTSSWLSTGWHFADPTNQYRTPTGGLEANAPQVVQYNVDFVAINFSPSTVAAVAFVTTDTDPFTSADTNANLLIVTDKHVAVRKLEEGVDWRVVLGIVLVVVGVAAAVIVAEEV
jgi:hypothetical protein